ncbi:MAG TPA: hypothetical protein VLJ13_07595 [Brevundimonas sp.]|nr:hypothetical protein [Brevundimonas sp.]
MKTYRRMTVLAVALSLLGAASAGQAMASDTGSCIDPDGKPRPCKIGG